MVEKEYPKWTDTHNISKIYKVKRRRGWLQVQVGINKKTKTYELRLRKPRVNFAVPSQEYLNGILALLGASSKYIGWEIRPYSDSTISQNVEKSEIYVSNPLVEKMLNQKQEKAAEEMKKARELKQQAIELITQYAPEQWELDLGELKNLLKDVKTKEKEIQNWIYEHTWIIGPYYIDANKEEKTRDDDRIDFIIQKIDTFYDIVELKLPTCKILENEDAFTGTNLLSPSREFPMSKDLTDSISQVMKYLEELEMDKTNKFITEGKLIHHPVAKIIIGQRSKINRTALRAINAKLNGIEILTYNDVVDAGENLIKLFKQARKPRKIRS